jgi:hypothetical protein
VLLLDPASIAVGAYTVRMTMTYVEAREQDRRQDDPFSVAR